MYSSASRTIIPQPGFNRVSFAIDCQNVVLFGYAAFVVVFGGMLASIIVR